MIRLATHSDFQFIFDLYMHPVVNPYLLYERMDATEFQPIFAQLLEAQVLYIFHDEAQAAGMFKLVPNRHRTSHIAYIGGVAIDPQLTGKGLGKKMFQEILALGQAQDLHRLELSVSVENRRAIELYTQCGFVAEGILRDYTYLKSEDRFINEVLMSYLYPHQSKEIN
ncbi:GNAT family N-acetyltransferase [Undibacterium fentianense]|uniref:GNAT family N-acetyltransferase n=1 Tax=Undibacterium fentianense TaxID=2828728 RepID=A0A941E2X8_9BURK|nr:GNAT family protein [Undibacterium fentianense]MBR7801350.1 GNAT family N-acetyltransferase [Undibacterium fentianense]